MNQTPDTGKYGYSISFHDQGAGYSWTLHIQCEGEEIKTQEGFVTYQAAEAAYWKWFHDPNRER